MHTGLCLLPIRILLSLQFARAYQHETNEWKRWHEEQAAAQQYLYKS
jgi:hypothetical protein